MSAPTPVDKHAEYNKPKLFLLSVIALATAGHELTITGVPPGSGQRMGLDRDRDGYPDADELAAATDPGDPASHPGAAGVPAVFTPRAGIQRVAPNPFHSATEVWFALAGPGRVSFTVYDLLGREVRHVLRGQRLEGGTHRLGWDGRRDDGGEAGAGVYFLRLRTDHGEWTRPAIRVK